MPTTFAKTPANRLARFCFRLLAPAVRCGRVVLAAETQGMQDELQRFTGLPVALFPHPVPPPKQEFREQGSAINWHEIKNKEQRTKNNEPITITCPGFARHEKGNDLLQQAILTILDGPDGDRFRFIMQWPESFILPDGSMLGPDSRLLNDPRVEFLNQSLDASAYETLLARSHFVILPYRRESYHHRVSRVAIEASSRGIPLIYTSGSWTREIAELAQCGVEIQDETVESITEAVEDAVQNLQKLRHAANEGVVRVSSFHSVNQFRRQLQEIH